MGTAFMTLTAAAPRSRDDNNDGLRKSPLRVHIYSSPGSRLSSMKHLSADKLWSSYTADAGMERKEGRGVDVSHSYRGVKREREDGERYQLDGRRGKESEGV